MSEEETGIDTAQDENVAVVVTEEETSTSEEEVIQEAEEPEQPETPRPKGAQKRISELTANWRSAERDRDHWRELATKEAPKKAEPEVVIPPPTLESCGHDEGKYQQEMARFLSAQVDSRLTEREEALQQKSEQREQQGRLQDFQAKGLEVAEDFAEVALRNDLPVTEAMAAAVMSVEKGAEVLYHLGKNPLEMSRIAALSPYAQAAEIGRLEARLSMPKPKKTTSALPPITPLKSGSSGVVDEDNMSTAEWIAHRNKTVHGA